MSPFEVNNYVSCCFDKKKDNYPDVNIFKADVYFALTDDIIPVYSKLENHFEKDDLIRASGFHFEEDRTTWLFSHTLLRLVISSKLGIKSSDVKFTNDQNKKPWLESNTMFFNLAHTRGAFAFALCNSVRVGIDIEKSDRKIDFKSIIRNFFTPGEIKFILEDPEYSTDKFFLLWTRKEALLKAIGTGLIGKLTDVEVFREINFIKRESFDNMIDNSILCEHFIYSSLILNYYMSVALPGRAKITINHLDADKVKFYLTA